MTVSNTVNKLIATQFTALRFDVGNGLIYTGGGQVIDPSKGATVGNYATATYGLTVVGVPDSAQNRVFYLGQTQAQSSIPSNNWTLQVFDQKGFNLLSSITIENVIGTPNSIIRWGTNGLAFTTQRFDPHDAAAGMGPGRLYVITGAFVNPAVPASSSSPTRFIH